jgi:hypothetical protein
MTTAQPTVVSATTPATGMLDAPTILKSEAVSTVEPARFPAKASKWSQRLSFEYLASKASEWKTLREYAFKTFATIASRDFTPKSMGGEGGASERSLLVGVQRRCTP